MGGSRGEGVEADPLRGSKDRQVDLEGLLGPLPDPMDCADEAELLDGRPCCCLAANGPGVHDGECYPDCRHDDG